jgi:tungstate transport system substrate-binding protein
MSILRKLILALLAILGPAVFLVGHASAREKSIVVASTSSTKDSGLFDHLLPLFTQKTGIVVNVLALGTGQALDAARHDMADVVLVHAKPAEQRFLAEGHGVKRYAVMYNDFVLIGPKRDPAGIKGMTDVAKALKPIRDQQATFISRGDHSGTHLKDSRFGRTPALTSKKKAPLGTNRLNAE